MQKISSFHKSGFLHFSKFKLAFCKNVICTHLFNSNWTRYWGIQLLFLQKTVSNMQIKDHPYVTCTRKSVEGEGLAVVLKFVMCFRILLFLNSISIIHFGGMAVWLSKNWPFFENIMNGWPFNHFLPIFLFFFLWSNPKILAI